MPPADETRMALLWAPFVRHDVGDNETGMGLVACVRGCRVLLHCILGPSWDFCESVTGEVSMLGGRAVSETGTSCCLELVATECARVPQARVNSGRCLPET